MFRTNSLLKMDTYCRLTFVFGASMFFCVLVHDNPPILRVWSRVHLHKLEGVLCATGVQQYHHVWPIIIPFTPTCVVLLHCC